MQIPDNIRPTVDIIVKHHFWMLAAVVPLVVLPLAWLAAGDLSQKIKTKQGAIDSKLSSVRNVQSTAEHPNEGWAEVLARDTAKVKRDTFAEWQRFYDEQVPIRVWPESLGEDFVERASRLQPGNKLPRSLLERYQDGVKNIVRALPKRFGAEESMPTAAADEESFRPKAGLPQGPRTGPQPIVRWDEADQKRLYDSFDWQKPPTTVQVQLAQEEIWMYQILCDILKQMNERATGAFDAAIPFVDELAVGYPAAEDKPGGAGEARILRVKSAAGPGMEPAPEEGVPAPGGPPGTGQLSRPSHPRFAGAGGRGLEGPSPGGAPAADGAVAASPDDIYRNWVYVGFDGKPLLGTEQTASLANRMIHLIPFRLRVVMDQRRLDDLLVKLAATPIPIDVRQVRVNPGTAGQQSGIMGMESRGPAGPPGSTGAARPYDVTVELRGSMAVAAYPDRKALLGDMPENEPAAEPPAEEPAEPQPGEPATDQPAEPAATQPAEPESVEPAPAPASDEPAPAPPADEPPAAPAGEEAPAAPEASS